VDPREQDVARILESLGPLPPPTPRPALVVLSGLPGSGKSTVAYALMQRVSAVLVQSDRVRKLLVPVPDYSTEESARVFAVIHAALERLLADGIPVILDATTLEEKQRRPLAQIAARAGARLVLVWVQAADREVRRRLAARHAGARAAYDVSDADVTVYEMMRARVEPIRGPHITVDTDRDYTPALDTLARIIGGTSEVSRQTSGV
jgi:predicted kinase